MVPHRDVVFGQIVRWLAAHGLEMHTPMKGETWVCRRRVKHSRRTWLTTTEAAASAPVADA